MSADRMTRTITGPDRGTIGDMYAPKTPAPDQRLAGFLPINTSGVSIDRNPPMDIYRQNLPSIQPSSLRLDLSPNSTKRNVVLSRSRANGAELQIDPQNEEGVGIAYIDSNLHPFFYSIHGVTIERARETSIGLNGKRERQYFFTGRNGLVALALSQLEIDPETITIKTKGEPNQTPATTPQKEPSSERAA